MKNFISCSIVLYQKGIGKNIVFNAISSILHSSLPVKLFLIDNSPTPLLQTELKEFISDSRVEYIFNNKNLGFGAAHNIAIRKIIGKSKYHLVLNPDVSFEENVLPAIYHYMQQNPDVGLVMPKVLYPDGSTQYICKLLPTPYDLILRRFLPGKLLEKQPSNYDLKNSGYNRTMEIPNLSGCFMFMRTSLFPVTGLFDEKFFLYLEDTDLSRRFYKVARNIFYPSVHIVHGHEQGSYKDFKLLFIHIRSAIRYFNKWGWRFDKERDQINKSILEEINNHSIEKKALKVKAA